MFASLGIDLPTGILLCLALLLALSFEFVNGFHDTANAVATVIYTNSLKPTQAVVWSGLWNLIGVLTSSGAVAFGIVALQPVLRWCFRSCCRRSSGISVLGTSACRRLAPIP
jgi:PiT family inorganic phosphate transporter